MYSFCRHVAVAATTLFLAGCGMLTYAQSARAVAASTQVSSADFRATARLAGHVPVWANANNDLGRISPGRRLENLHLILNRAPGVQGAFDQLLADQQNPASPRYHQWLTPQQNAERYGLAPADLSAVTGWLQSQGLTVDDVAGGGLFITFGGPVSIVENAFSTSLHSFSHENASRYAPTADPAIPAALVAVIQSVDGLAEEVAHVHSHSAIAAATDVAGPQPLFTFGSSTHYISPGDFNTIYDINATHNAGINGSGERVVNLIDSRIVATDITGFNSVFGLSVAQPNTIVLPSSTDPGVKADSEGEAALDVQRILGTAPGASVDLLVFSSLSLSNIFSALQYEVGTLNDPIVNMSFGSCNSAGSSFASSSFDTYFKAGAAQGISFFVSSGDSAAAGCDSDSTTIPTTQVLATNLICASSYATCVGGTEFAEAGGDYWSGSNSSTRVSATSYIPEGAWDEPTSVSGGRTTYQASGTGGGLTLFPKPSWQTGTGVPLDGLRDVPDVSFTSSYHDGYLVCQGDVGNVCSSSTFRYITFGTSASSPSMAGIAAMLDEKLGARQGNLNPLFYSLAATPSNGVFHDVTVTTSGVSSCSTAIPSICNNSTPSSTSLTGGLAGYAVATGYDLATGLGSLDVANFFAAAAPSSGPSFSTSLALQASANPITTAQTVAFTATLTSSATVATASGTVQFYSNGAALGAPIALSTSGTATTPLVSFPTPGTFAITAIYSGDNHFVTSTSAPVSLTVNAAVTPAFTLAEPSSLSFVAGATSGNTETITLTSLNGFTGSVALTCTISASTATNPPVCTLTPSSVTLAAGATAATVAVITTAPARISDNANPPLSPERSGLPAGGTVFALLLCLIPFRRLRAVRSLAMLLLLTVGFTVLSGCGGGGNVSVAATTSTLTSYTVTVIGMGTPIGSAIVATASSTFTVMVD